MMRQAQTDQLEGRAHLRTTLLLLFLASITAGCTSAHTQPENGDDAHFQAFLRQWEEAQARFLQGDPTLWKENASHLADVTILGGFGGPGEKGWEAVGARYDWASSQYRRAPATVEVEYLNVVVRNELAFTVAIERQTAARIGEEPAPRRVLRATQIFRRENGAWKLVHRHADAALEKRAP